MKLIRTILTVFLLTGFCFILPSFAADDDDVGFDNAKAQTIKAVTLFSDISLYTDQKIQYGKPRIVVKAVIPQLQSESDNPVVSAFNDEVDEVLQNAVAEFQKRVDTAQTYQASLARSSVKNDLILDYDSSYITSGSVHILSIRFTMQGVVTGMAHPYRYHRVLNFNLDNGDIIELNDLFKTDSNYLSTLSTLATESLTKRAFAKSFIAEGAAPNADNYANWNLKPNGIMITFEEAQVAPYAHGTQSVLIPYSALENVIADDSVIEGCVKHSKKCSRSNLLTGGFIDVAVNSAHRSFNPILG